MKKALAIIMCILTVIICASAMAENAAKEDYTVVSVNGAFNIQGVTPEGYQRTDIQIHDSIILVSFSTENTSKPYFDLVISFAEEYARVERLNDLTEEEMMELVDDDPTLSDKIDIMETDYGTKVMILRSNNPMDDFASFVTVYKGYEVALNLFPGKDSAEPLTDDQIKQAMKFLSDLDFVPVG